MKKRLLFAAVDVGYRVENFTKYLAENYSDQISTESFVKYQAPNTHYKAQYDFVIDYYTTNRIYRSLAYFLFFLKSLFRYDVFYFISGETILSRRLRRFELKTYKLLGKRVVFNFVGSDIRSENYLIWKQTNIYDYLQGKSAPPKSEDFQKKLIDDALRYADSILVSTPDLLEITPQATYFPVVYDIENLAAEIESIEEPEKDPNKIYILHSPSNTGTKGTAIINDVLEKIKREFPAAVELIRPYNEKNYELTHSVSRYKLFQLMKQADIVIDQMVIGWYGLQSIEALITGKTVVCYIEKNLEKFLFEDCPIVTTDVLSLEQTLKNCMAERQMGILPDKRKQIEWLKKYHTPEANGQILLNSIDIR